ncbi:MAG: rhomboid family intramembrane serine protease [Clostridium sp.]
MENYRNKSYVNGILIAINVLYFLYLEIVGSTVDTGFMIEKGAMYIPLMIQQGQYYRLLTSVFMHFGISHLLNNMLVLFVLGDNLERALGKVKYLIFYLLCGVGANIISLTFNMEMNEYYIVSAGASGAIFGVVGGLVYAVIVNRGRLEDLGTAQLMILILFTLYHGFTSAGIDNAAHIGGLIIGILLGVILYRKPKRKKQDSLYG